VKKGKIDKDLFEGATINTPSMLAVEDYIDALQWADSIGGLPGLINRSVKNYKVRTDSVHVHGHRR
jgi:phosphoserine aminotransferase